MRTLFKAIKENKEIEIKADVGIYYVVEDTEIIEEFNSISVHGVIDKIADIVKFSDLDDLKITYIDSYIFTYLVLQCNSYTSSQYEE